MTERLGPNYIPEDAETSPIKLTELIDLSPFHEQEPRRTAVLVLGQSTRKAPGFSVDEICVTAGVSKAKSLGKGTDLYIISRNAQKLAEFARNKGFSKEDGEIIAVLRSGSTPKQGETMEKILRGLDYLDILLVIPSFQKRAKGVLEAWGTRPLEVVSAEEEYMSDSSISPEEMARRQALIKRWHRSVSYGVDLLWELGLALEQKVDRKQKVPMVVASVLRRGKV